MNRRFATISLSLAVAGTIGFGVPKSSWAQVVRPGGDTTWPVLPKQKIKTPVQDVEIYQLDDEALGERKPLLLVHGLGGENLAQFRWGDVASHLNASKDFRASYKIYLARHNTVQPIATVVPAFRKSIADLYRKSGHRPITAVALSIGGNLMQESMADSSIDTEIEKVLAMGTPFHGSPLFTYDWMRYGFLKNHRVPWIKADLLWTYRLYFSKHQNLLTDFHWDNSDKNIPDVGDFRAYVPWRVRGDLSATLDANARMIKINEELKTDKSKYITYGGYLLAPWAKADRPSFVWSALHLPTHFWGTTVPFHFGREHPALRMLNREISWVPPSSPAETDSRATSNKIMYGLNDGITPLGSALFLPTSSFRQIPVLSETDVSGLSKYVDVRKARVFPNIDHITYIEGYRPFRASTMIGDQLHPNEAQRKIFDWILTDIMDTNTAADVAGMEAGSDK